MRTRRVVGVPGGRDVLEREQVPAGFFGLPEQSAPRLRPGCPAMVPERDYVRVVVLAISEASALCGPALGCWPRALARRPRVRPRQGAQAWRSSRATVVTLMPASAASVCWDSPRCLCRRRSCNPSRKNTCGRMRSPSCATLGRSPAVTGPRSRTRLSTPCPRHQCGPSSGLTGRQREAPGRSGRRRELAGARGHPGR